MYIVFMQKCIDENDFTLDDFTMQKNTALEILLVLSYFYH